MLKRIGNIILYSTIVALLLLNGTAHEFVHSFTGHEDTIDMPHHAHHEGELFFENEHHHCSFLNLEIPVFDNPLFHPAIKAEEYFHNIFIESSESKKIESRLYARSDRGPPAASAFLA